MTHRRPLRLIIVNDYEVVVHGLRGMLRSFPDRVVVVDGVTGAPDDVPADVALYDTFAAHELTNVGIKADHLVLYTNNTGSAYLTAARAVGADAVLHKSLTREDLVAALERIVAGETIVMKVEDGVVTEGTWPGKDGGLSEREAEVVALIAQGLSNEQVADATFLSINTVKSYIRSAYRKMGVTNRSQAVAWGVEHGFAKRPDGESQPADAF